MAGETAASCGVLEREAVFLLCGHAAKRAVDKALVQAALDMLAARLGYASRATLMAYHKQTLVFDWCCSGYSLQQFLAVQVQELPRCTNCIYPQELASLNSTSAVKMQ